jgi:hypothetical protein
MKIRPQIRKHHLLSSLLLVCSGLLACAGANNETAADNPAAGNPVRIIIGFNLSTINPQDPVIVQTISDKLGTELQFIRGLSADAAVYSGHFQQNKEELITRLEQLKTIAYIKYAELDQRRQIQPRQ